MANASQCVHWYKIGKKINKMTVTKFKAVVKIDKTKTDMADASTDKICATIFTHTPHKHRHRHSIESNGKDLEIFVRFSVDKTRN